MVSAKLDNWFTQSMYIWATPLITSRKTFEQEYYPYWKRILDCDLSIWVAVKNVQNCQVKTRWCLLPEKFLTIKKCSNLQYFKILPKKHQKDRGDPQMAGQCYLIFTLSDTVIESDLRQLNSACSLKRARFGNKQIVKMAQSIFSTQIVNWFWDRKIQNPSKKWTQI